MLTLDALFSSNENLTVKFCGSEDLNAKFAGEENFGVDIQNLTVVRVSEGSCSIATTSTLGCIIVGENLKITSEGVLSVDMAGDISEDNTRPISSAKVYTEIGNINALLETI